MGFSVYDAPSPAGKSCSRKVNQILPAGVGWIARSDCGSAGVVEARVKNAATAEERACRRPASSSIQREMGFVSFDLGLATAAAARGFSQGVRETWLQDFK
jgi:hypothetical protein